MPLNVSFFPLHFLGHSVDPRLQSILQCIRQLAHSLPFCINTWVSSQCKENDGWNEILRTQEEQTVSVECSVSLWVADTALSSPSRTVTNLKVKMQKLNCLFFAMIFVIGDDISQSIGEDLVVILVDRGSWWATVHRVANSQKWLSNWYTCVHVYIEI